MKYKLSIFITYLVLAFSYANECKAQYDLQRDSLVLTFSVAEQMMREHSLLLRSKNCDVETAKAGLQQDRLLENPEVNIQHNVYNPVTHRYFETGYEGQTDIQISQRIFIGGQRGERVRRSQADVEKSKYDRDDTERLMCRDLYISMAALACGQQKTDILSKEIASVDKILAAYEQQMKKGNISRLELIRIRSLRLQLLEEQNNQNLSIAKEQHLLRLMLGLMDETIVVPEISDQYLSSLISQLQINQLYDNLKFRPDLMANSYDVKSGEHEVKLQQANALPEVNLTGEWDKNGSIGHNYFGAGVTLSIPLFNRNQGTIKAAKASLQSKRLQQQLNVQSAHSGIDSNWNQLMKARQIAEEANRQMSGDMDDLLRNAENQYLKRNISLLELLDQYQSYKDIHFMLLENKCNAISALANLDVKIK